MRLLITAILVLLIIGVAATGVWLALASTSGPTPDLARLSEGGSELAAAGARAIEQIAKRPIRYRNPFAGKTLYFEADTPPARQADLWREDRPLDADAMEVLASQPRAIWLGSWSADIELSVKGIVDAASGAGQLPVLVAYNVPSFSCEEYIANRSAVEERYLAWIAGFARGIGSRPAVVVLEPDAIAGRECLNQVAPSTHLMRRAIQELKKNKETIVYLDAGHQYWNSVDQIVGKLTNAGIDIADGFSLNVSNFITNEGSIAYGSAISAKVKNKHFIIDTSRNGNGPTVDYEWCNPPGRAIGTFPTIATDLTLVDAYLWIKQPGESDGTCNGGPPAGSWWPEYALELVRNRSASGS